MLTKKRATAQRIAEKREALRSRRKRLEKAKESRRVRVTDFRLNLSNLDLPHLRKMMGEVHQFSYRSTSGMKDAKEIIADLRRSLESLQDSLRRVLKLLER